MVEGIALLREINKDNPTNSAALEAAISEGFNVDQLFRRANEVGEFVYKSDEDPDALVNRFQLQVLYGPRGPLPRGLNRGLNDEYYDPEYYRPGPDAVRRTRELVALEVKAATEERIELQTTDDYINYFRSFHPDALRLMLTNLSSIELTFGCNTACVVTCAVPAAMGVKNQMPFPVLKWLVASYPEELKKAHVVLYGDGDMQFYSSQDEDGRSVDAVDALKLFHGIGVKPYVSVAIGPKLIDFLYRLVVVEKLEVQRISRLIAGTRDDAFGSIIERLNKKHKTETGEDEIPVDAQMVIHKAFLKGDKSAYNTTLGNAVIRRRDIRERDISTLQVHCYHGVSLTRNGFNAKVIRPPSKLFPYGQIRYPLSPKDQCLRIPRYSNMEDVYMPFTFEHVVSGPRFVVINPVTGEVVSDDGSYPNRNGNGDLLCYYREHHLKMLTAPDGDAANEIDKSVQAFDRYMKLLDEGESKDVVHDFETALIVFKGLLAALTKIIVIRGEVLAKAVEMNDEKKILEACGFDELIKKKLYDRVVQMYQRLVKKFDEMRWSVEDADRKRLEEIFYRLINFMRQYLPRVDGSMGKGNEVVRSRCAKIEELREACLRDILRPLKEAGFSPPNGCNIFLPERKGQLLQFERERSLADMTEGVLKHFDINVPVRAE